MGVVQFNSISSQSKQQITQHYRSKDSTGYCGVTLQERWLNWLSLPLANLTSDGLVTNESNLSPGSRSLSLTNKALIGAKTQRASRSKFEKSSTKHQFVQVKANRSKDSTGFTSLMRTRVWNLKGAKALQLSRHAVVRTTTGNLQFGEVTRSQHARSQRVLCGHSSVRRPIGVQIT